MSGSEPQFGKYRYVGVRQVAAQLSRALPKRRFFFRLGLLLRKLSLQKNLLVDAEIFGIKLRLDPTRNLGDRFVLFTPQYFENEEREYLEARYSNKKITFIDIGANTGFYTLFINKIAGAGSQILAIEPNPEVLPRLRYHVQENTRTDIDVKIVPVGVSDSKGEFEFSYVPGNWGSWSVVHKEHSLKSRIPCLTLVEILHSHKISKIDLLKIDIEGGELKALKPFFENAPRELWPELLIIESENDLNLEQLGYKKLKRTGSHNSIYEKT